MKSAVRFAEGVLVKGPRMFVCAVLFAAFSATLPAVAQQPTNHVACDGNYNIPR
jgi:hypothetical protein